MNGLSPFSNLARMSLIAAGHGNEYAAHRSAGAEAHCEHHRLGAHAYNYGDSGRGVQLQGDAAAGVVGHNASSRLDRVLDVQ